MATQRTRSTGGLPSNERGANGSRPTLRYFVEHSQGGIGLYKVGRVAGLVGSCVSTALPADKGMLIHKLVRWCLQWCIGHPNL